ncbi:hypothetical protein QOZ80_9AG0688270 [Eleusine coracana subsp. coracana]|nr:hypothetical protein QOZ80_9AG0688270 [Eleusine coracana subsp. coracana]
MKDTMEQQRASIPAFGGWEDMAAAAGGGAGALPDYSLDFSKIRAARMQRRKAQSWSSGVNGIGEEQQSSTAAAGGGSEDHERHRRHRRQHSDAAEARQPIRGPPKTGKSNKVKGYFFGCMGRW